MKTFVHYLLILVFTDLAYSQNILNLLPKFYAKAKSVYCDNNPKYVENLTCKLKPINWERSYFEFECDLLQVFQNVTINLEAFKYTNQFRPFLINTTFNYCEMVGKGRAKNPYLRTAMNILAKFSNLFHKCPLAGHLYIRDAYLDLSWMPFYMPIGRYKLVAKLLEDWPLNQIGIVSYIFDIVEVKNVTRNIPKRGRLKENMKALNLFR